MDHKPHAQSIKQEQVSPLTQEQQIYYTRSNISL